MNVTHFSISTFSKYILLCLSFTSLTAKVSVAGTVACPLAAVRLVSRFFLTYNELQFILLATS